MLDIQNCLQNHIKNAKATKFLLQSAFYTYKGSLRKGLPFYDFWYGLGFMVSSVASTRSSTSYAYLLTKIGNPNLKRSQPYPSPVFITKTRENIPHLLFLS